jgi:hypothetical protein
MNKSFEHISDIVLDKLFFQMQYSFKILVAEGIYNNSKNHLKQDRLMNLQNTGLG